MKLMPIASILGALVLGGCGSNPLTTGSLLGGNAPAKPEGPVVPANTPFNRAFQVGSVSARAVKCGFNFDPARVKSNFVAAETTAGTSVEDMAKVEKAYAMSYNGVLKAAAAKPDYCTDKKSREIKADLALLLAGDYSPQALRPKEEDNEGLFVGGTQFKWD